MFSFFATSTLNFHQNEETLPSVVPDYPSSSLFSVGISENIQNSVHGIGLKQCVLRGNVRQYYTIPLRTVFHADPIRMLRALRTLFHPERLRTLQMVFRPALRILLRPSIRPPNHLRHLSAPAGMCCVIRPAIIVDTSGHVLLGSYQLVYKVSPSVGILILSSLRIPPLGA
jgi:hypothetical protein